MFFVFTNIGNIRYLFSTEGIQYVQSSNKMYLIIVCEIIEFRKKVQNIVL